MTITKNMAQVHQVYKCLICGNITEVLHAGGGELVCCGQPMLLEKEKQNDTGTEKHKPIIEVNEDKTVVKIGENPHPMEEAHYIEWIELNNKNKTSKKFLNPGEEPVAIFNEKGEKARAYCNIHGLWEA